jgi:hypothetical protein
MTQVDLGAAGIQANIEHWQSQVLQQQQALHQAESELIFWCLIQKEHSDETARTS